VVAIEHLELALIGLPRGALLLGQALDQGLELIGTTLPAFTPRFESAPLARRLHLVELAEPNMDETTEVVRAFQSRIAEHHGVEIDESLIEVVVDAAQPLAGCFPAKAIALLDAAAAAAALSSESAISRYDIRMVADKIARNCN
jgi:type VI secretion system protein VasG